VIFTKVLGHAKQEQVRRGLVKQEDKDGNDAADALATLAADAHAAPQILVRSATLRMEQAVATHRMMLEILAARRAAEVQMGLAGAALFEEEDDDNGMQQGNVEEEATNVGGTTEGATLVCGTMDGATTAGGTMVLANGNAVSVAAGSATGNAVSDAAGNAAAPNGDVLFAGPMLCLPVEAEPG